MEQSQLIAIVVIAVVLVLAIYMLTKHRSTVPSSPSSPSPQPAPTSEPATITIETDGFYYDGEPMYSPHSGATPVSTITPAKQPIASTSLAPATGITTMSGPMTAANKSATTKMAAATKAAVAKSKLTNSGGVTTFPYLDKAITFHWKSQGLYKSMPTTGGTYTDATGATWTVQSVKFYCIVLTNSNGNPFFFITSPTKNGTPHFPVKGGKGNDAVGAPYCTARSNTDPTTVEGNPGFTGSTMPTSPKVGWVGCGVLPFDSTYVTFTGDQTQFKPYLAPTLDKTTIAAF